MSATDTRNLLLDPLSVEYAIEETHLGTWRRHVDPNGQQFAEYVSHASLIGLPMVHVVRGRDPATKRLPTACGVIAIGRKAVGVIAIGQWARGIVAIGQASVGIIAIGQAAFGILFGLGQLATGAVALGQCAVGYVAVGQVSAGYYGLGMGALAVHPWDMSRTDPAAEQFFRGLLPF